MTQAKQVLNLFLNIPIFFPPKIDHFQFLIDKYRPVFFLSLFNFGSFSFVFGGCASLRRLKMYSACISFEIVAARKYVHGNTYCS